MIEEFLKKGVTLNVYDPEAMSNVKKRFGNSINYMANMYDGIKNADALIICTEWSIFRTPDFNKLKQNMNQPVIFDGRNLYDTYDLKKEGFVYNSIGRKVIY